LLYPIAAMRILLIEDDPVLGDGLKEFVQSEGHVVEWVRDLSQARAALRGQPFDAWVVDWQLPDGSGQAWLQTERGAGQQTPALLATARDQLADRLHGLNNGADDYLVKPFDPEELVARLQAVARRAAGRASNVYRSGALALDLQARSAHVDGEPVALTAREWAIVEALLLRPGRTVSKDVLENLVVGFDGCISANALEVHISSIRRKLGRDRIETRRGLGYCWNQS
jgi:two-component system, OmpR family, response regulator